jgi:putative FmdB family regulatory protein
MPIYEYECQKCKTKTEVFQKLSDKPIVKCTKCGGRLEKQISAPAIQFKGSGWYVTDYAAKSKSSDKGESDGGKGDTGDKADDKKADKKTKESSPESKTSSKASSSKLPSKD